jgi:hypothetical protein
VRLPGGDRLAVSTCFGVHEPQSAIDAFVRTALLKPGVDAPTLLLRPPIPPKRLRASDHVSLAAYGREWQRRRAVALDSVGVRSHACTHIKLSCWFSWPQRLTYG